MDKQRVNLNMPVDTLKRLDDYAERMTITRTSAILVLVNQALDGQNAISAIEELNELAKKLSV